MGAGLSFFIKICVFGFELRKLREVLHGHGGQAIHTRG